MEELKRILRTHAAKYPQMQPTDAVKLIYQNEFGGGHLISDPDAVTRYLHREYESVTKSPDAALYEDIGNGIVRVNLAALRGDAVQRLGEAFLRSATAHKGEMPRFLEKLALLSVLCAEGVFSFDLAALDAYLDSYEQAGYPMVSHSEAYRTAYHPAYRIVTKDELSGLQIL